MEAEINKKSISTYYKQKLGCTEVGGVDVGGDG